MLNINCILYVCIVFFLISLYFINWIWGRFLYIWNIKDILRNIEEIFCNGLVRDFILNYFLVLIL